MKKALSSLLLIAVVFMFAACASKKPENEPDYKKLTDDINNKGKSTINTKEIDESNNSNNNTDKNDVAENPEWPYPLSFDGIGSNNISVQGNTNNFNLKYYHKASGLVCPDNDRNCLYYVNYGQDNYIYQLKDGISTLLLDKEAYCLQLWENELYFLSPKKS